MPDAPTPGQIAYAAYYRRLCQHPALVTVPRLAWETLHPEEQAAWEAAAQAVLEACAMLCPICGAELERCNAKGMP